MPDPRKVFVVYGRHEGLRRSMFSFLRSLSLQPLEWEHATALTKKTAPYVGEILDAAFSEAQAIIVLLTPDDEVRLAEHLWTTGESKHETDLQFQPRANVIFEAGLALGRNPDRTVLLEFGRPKSFSDLLGRHLIQMKDSAATRHALVNRLRTAGCDVDSTGSDWLHTEQFQLVEQRQSPNTQTEAEAASKLDSRDRSITQDESSILKHLAQAEEQSVRLTVIHIQGLLKVSATRAEYLLEKLEESGLVDATWNTSAPTRYSLTRAGRRYLVENDLVR